MTTGRFERSEDGGKTWAVIDPQVMRRRLANTYRNVDAVIAAMVDDGQPVRTNFASYRFNRGAGQTSVDEMVEATLAAVIGYPPVKS